ncbi:hypothetical protein [Hyphobacterium sp.]|jgi:hypothetical protein|uniref:hypothetical protein n=1 Tax=Hyphobacterium sp. TaxID=2004662 RepID=UPI003BA89C12
MLMNFLIALGVFVLLFVAFIAVVAADMRPLSRAKAKPARPEGNRLNPSSNDPVAPN